MRMVYLVLGKDALKSAQLRYSNPEVTQKEALLLALKGRRDI